METQFFLLYGVCRYATTFWHHILLPRQTSKILFLLKKITAFRSNRKEEEKRRRKKQKIQCANESRQVGVGINISAPLLQSRSAPTFLQWPPKPTTPHATKTKTTTRKKKKKNRGDGEKREKQKQHWNEET